MSQYGPPGPPPEPWSPRSPDEGYAEPADPWRDQDPWVSAGAPPPSGPLAAGPSGPLTGSTAPAGPVPPGGAYGAPGAAGPPWGAPHAPARPPSRSALRRGPLLAGLGVVAVLVTGALAASQLLSGPGSPAGDRVAGGVSPTPGASAGGSSPTSGGDRADDARFARRGTCLVREGTEERPVMRIAPCGPGTYEVLARFDGTTDYLKRCRGVEGYRYWYRYDAQTDALDYVLCLGRR
ncbi:MAG TPA: hypothetical protein VNV66_07960 [Pilimelia sp.]|nr:hypothetical protein [Pilimelia sp.]